MNKGYLRLISLVLLGAILAMPASAQNYRVKAQKYERGLYSPETNPASVRYAIIDLGPDGEPIRLTNSGYILLQPTKSRGLQRRWFQGQFQDLKGGDEDWLIGTRDMNEAGTVVGSVLEYKPGSASEYGIANGYAFDSPSTWYGGTSYGIRVASQWVVGSSTALPLGQPKFPFTIWDQAENSPHTGFATSGGGTTIDNDGHVYGQAMVAYEDYTPSTDGTHFPTRWGSAVSGYDFTTQTKFGDQRLVYHPEPVWSGPQLGFTDRYVTEGHPHYIDKVRNEVTMAHGVENGEGRNYISGQPVDFVPVTLNSQGVVLASSVVNPNLSSSYTKYFIYDPVTGTQTDLPMKKPRFGSGAQPVALNHRLITVTNTSGQSVMKKSPQIIGIQGGSAVIWEENPKTGQYFYQYLDLLIPENSGWNLKNAKDINDNGAIICTGTFQAKDADGNPVGNPETRACLLQPTPPIDFEFKLEHQGPPEVHNYVQNNSTLQNGTKPDLRTDITITTQPASTIGAVTSSRGTVDHLNPATVVTGADGKFKTTLSTREKTPALKLAVKEVKSAEHHMLPALYKNIFHITGYFTPSESDPRFTGPLVTRTTLFTGSGTTQRRYDITSSRAAKEDFLKSIAVEGEGYFSDGTHAVVSNRTTPGTSNPIETTTTVTSDNLPPKGTRNRNLVANSSCAIVRNSSTGDGIVVPDAATLQIVGQSGRWSAIDRVSGTETGGTYHIDLYKGFDRVAANMISVDTEVILLGY